MISGYQRGPRQKVVRSHEVGYLSGEITTGLELFEEGRHEEGGEEQDGWPEENIWGVGTMVAARRPHKLSMQTDTLLWRFREVILTKTK